MGKSELIQFVTMTSSYIYLYIFFESLGKRLWKKGQPSHIFHKVCFHSISFLSSNGSLLFIVSLKNRKRTSSTEQFHWNCGDTNWDWKNLNKAVVFNMGGCSKRGFRGFWGFLFFLPNILLRMWQAPIFKWLFFFFFTHPSICVH